MLLYKRVTDMLQQRTERIEQSLKEADQVNQRLANAQREYDEQMAKARQEAAAVVSQAHERAKGQEAEIIAQAREESERIRSDARVQAERERDQLLREVKGQLAEIVTLAAQRVLQSELSAKGHDDRIRGIYRDNTRSTSHSSYLLRSIDRRGNQASPNSLAKTY